MIKLEILLKKRLKLLALILLIHIINNQLITAQELENEQQTIQTNKSTIQKVEFSGFGDFLTIIEHDDSHQIFEIGQAELDIEFPYSESSLLSLAISYDDSKFTLGSFYYEYSFTKKNSAVAYTLGIGQFDVPFGIDWEVYPSIDRNLITSPLIVSETHDSWNDLGIYFNFENKVIKSTIFTINGFSHECVDKNNIQIVTESNYAVGSRVAFIMIENLEIGGSIAYVDDKQNLHNLNLYGVDMSWSLKNLSLKAEYIQHIVNNNSKNLEDSGYYIQSKYDLHNLYLVSRISSHKHIDADYAYQYSSGIGITIQKNVIVRTELQRDSENNSSSLFMQLAVRY